MRSLRREFVSVATVFAIPVIVLFFFPFDALSFKATSSPTGCSPSAAFVTLTPEQESAALVAARTAWQTDAAARQCRNVWLPLGELPDKANGALSGAAVIPIPNVSPAPLEFRPDAWKPSLMSPAPERLQRVPESPSVPTFSREDLLKIN